jgi:hypothetical protein
MTQNRETRRAEAELYATIDDLEKRYRFMMGVTKKLAEHVDRSLTAAEQLVKQRSQRETNVSASVVDLLAVVSGSPCYCGEGCAMGTCSRLSMDELRAPLIQLAISVGVMREATC